MPGCAPANRWPTSPACANSGRCRWSWRRQYWCRDRRPSSSSNSRWRASTPRPRRIADLGTGSGAIALALAKERPAWWLIATDFSHDVLQIAQINRERLQVGNVELRQGRWCDALGSEPYDAILSNPPYIAPGHPALAALRHEPLEALVAGDDGYADLLAIAAGARSRLKRGGLLLLEHGADQAARLARELAGLGYADIACPSRPCRPRPCHRGELALKRVSLYCSAPRHHQERHMVASKPRRVISRWNCMPRRHPSASPTSSPTWTKASSTA